MWSRWWWHSTYLREILYELGQRLGQHVSVRGRRVPCLLGLLLLVLSILGPVLLLLLSLLGLWWWLGSKRRVTVCYLDGL